MPDPMAKPNLDQRRQAVSEFHKLHSDRHRKLRDLTRRTYYILNSVAAIASGLTPVLIIAHGVPKYVQALFPAVASVLIALDGIWLNRQNWLRHARAVAELNLEWANYETRTGDYKEIQ